MPSGFLVESLMHLDDTFAHYGPHGTAALDEFLSHAPELPQTHDQIHNGS